MKEKEKVYYVKDKMLGYVFKTSFKPKTEYYKEVSKEEYEYFCLKYLGKIY